MVTSGPRAAPVGPGDILWRFVPRRRPADRRPAERYNSAVGPARPSRCGRALRRTLVETERPMARGALEREIETYLARTPKSRALQAEAAGVLPGGSSRGTAYFAPYPFFAQAGEGHYVWDVDGNRYLDFMLNATSLILGHAHPAVVEGLAAQAAQGTAFSTPTMSQIRLARLLCDRIPSLDTVRFTNSGTEGTLMAIRAARTFTGRPKMAKFEGGYHGAHEHVAVSVHPPADRLDPRGPTAIPEYPGQPAAVLQDVVVLPYNDLEGSERLLRAH